MLSQRILFRIEGMDCEACARRLTTAVKRLDGIHATSTDAAVGALQIDAAPEIDLAAVTKCVEEAGFNVVKTERIS